MNTIFERRDGMMMCMCSMLRQPALACPVRFLSAIRQTKSGTPGRCSALFICLEGGMGDEIQPEMQTARGANVLMAR